MKNSGGLVRLRQAFVDLCCDGFKIGPDKWQRLRRAALIREASYRNRSGEYVIHKKTYQRLREILIIEKSMRHRPTAARIAFELAYGGANDVPWDLVSTHIEDSLLGFLKQIRRVIGRVGSGGTLPSNPPECSLDSRARLIARRYLRRLRGLSPVARGLARDILYRLFKMILTVSFKGGDYQVDNSSGFRRILMALGFPESQARELGNGFSKLLSEAAPSVTSVFTQNNLVTTLRKSAKQPAVISEAIRQARLVLPIAIGLFYIAVPQDLIPKLSTEIEEARDYFRCWVICLMLAVKDNQHAQKLLCDLQSGQIGELDIALKNLDDLRARIPMLLRAKS
jgi:hypothetical protein